MTGSFIHNLMSLLGIIHPSRPQGVEGEESDGVFGVIVRGKRKWMIFHWDHQNLYKLMERRRMRERGRREAREDKGMQ